MTPFARAAVSSLCLLLLAPAVAAQEGRAALELRSLAATCASCHGTDGHAVAQAAVPGLAGMPAERLVAQMKAFRAGAREATVMHQIAKGYTDAQVARLAAYFAAQPP